MLNRVVRVVTTIFKDIK